MNESEGVDIRVSHHQITAAVLALHLEYHELDAGGGVFVAVVSVDAALYVALQVRRHQLLERVLVVGPAVMRERQRRVHHVRVHHLERPQVILEPVPDQDRLGFDEASQVVLHLMERLGRARLQVPGRDSREASVVVDDGVLGADEGLVDDGPVDRHHRHLGQLEPRDGVTHLAVDSVYPVETVLGGLLSGARLHETLAVAVQPGLDAVPDVQLAVGAARRVGLALAAGVEGAVALSGGRPQLAPVVDAALLRQVLVGGDEEALRAAHARALHTRQVRLALPTLFRVGLARVTRTAGDASVRRETRRGHELAGVHVEGAPRPGEGRVVYVEDDGAVLERLHRVPQAVHLLVGKEMGVEEAREALLGHLGADALSRRARTPRRYLRFLGLFLGVGRGVLASAIFTLAARQPFSARTRVG
jgi:hypothetical protein